MSKQKLLQRIAKSFDVACETLVFNDVSVRFYRVENPNEMDLDLATNDSCSEQTWQPYWVEAWESANVVCQKLSTMNLDGDTVLDLGCGLGVTGAVLAARGAKVLMVDAAPPALLFAQLNTWPWRESVEIRQFDWHHDSLFTPTDFTPTDISSSEISSSDNAPHPFSLIVGSDILYDKDDWPTLERLWKKHLAVGGKLLLGEPGRRVGDEFLDWIKTQGWQVLIEKPATNEGNKLNRLIWLTAG